MKCINYTWSYISQKDIATQVFDKVLNLSSIFNWKLDSRRRSDLRDSFNRCLATNKPCSMTTLTRTPILFLIKRIIRLRKFNPWLKNSRTVSLMSLTTIAWITWIKFFLKIIAWNLIKHLIDKIIWALISKGNQRVCSVRSIIKINFLWKFYKCTSRVKYLALLIFILRKIRTSPDRIAHFNKLNLREICTPKDAMVFFLVKQLFYIL